MKRVKVGQDSFPCLSKEITFSCLRVWPFFWGLRLGEIILNAEFLYAAMEVELLGWFGHLRR